MNTPAARRVDGLVAAEEVALEASHAIQNPLATMVLAVGRIERSIAGSDTSNGMATAVKHLKEAVSILNRAMCRYKDASSWLRLTLREVDLAGMLHSIARIAGLTSGADVHLEICGALPSVEADSDCLFRALLGLVWQAVGDDPGGKRVDITAEYESGPEGAVVIRIGSGDSVVCDERLLRPFKHVAPERFDLGLARRIVELHHGSLQLADSGGRIVSRVSLPTAAAGCLPEND
jgi:nitrogen fixation/metabolism regulation signal transduction histidine kinase